MDRALIAEAIERTLLRDPDLGTWAALERAAKISHTQMYRVKRASPQVSMGMFHRLEGALGFPYDTLATVGVHDVEGLREIGAPLELVRWLESKVKKGSGPAAEAQ